MLISEDDVSVASKYTIVFDVFSVSEIFESNTKAAELYARTLVHKGIIKPTTVHRESSWISQLYNSGDIFTKRNPCPVYKDIEFSQWTERILNFNYSILKHTLKFPDYRFSAIELTPIDFGDQAMSFSKSLTKERLNGEIIGAGVVRLYKDSDTHLNTTKIIKGDYTHIPGDETTVAILAIPFYFSVSDLLIGVLDEKDVKQISHLRLVKSSTPNKFMLLIKFRSKEYVKPFIRKYQGKKFNSFEPETCSVLQIKEILIRPKNEEELKNVKSSLPYLLEDPFTNVKSSSKPAGKSIQKYTELATCPVCLDRLDSDVSGLLTIPCQHTFHSDCLSKWSDDSCPVCRNALKPNKNKRLGTSLLNESTLVGFDSTEKCMDCGNTKSIWICLICGNVGCGRYEQKHAIKHWEETGHCFSMESNTQRVWDYAEDGYVHRLVQNEADGKIVELPLHDESKKSNEEKIDKIGFEYSKLLITQLESQREYYENQLSEFKSSLVYEKSQVNKLEKMMEELKVTVSESVNEMSILREEQRRKNEEKASLKEQNNNLLKLNKAMVQKLKMYETNTELLKKENEELHEQVSDLMFFLESREKLKDSSDDVKEGKLFMVPKNSK
ncbi:unnamed protein product [Pichia kudriavzevii]